MKTPLPAFRNLATNAACLVLAIAPYDGAAIVLARDVAILDKPDGDVLGCIISASASVDGMVAVLMSLHADMLHDAAAAAIKSRLDAAIMARKELHRAVMAYYGEDCAKAA